MSTKITRATKRGAELLDEWKPGWWKTINTEFLDMEDENLCILGQLFGSFGEEKFIRKTLRVEESWITFSVKYGFDLWGLDEVPALTASWLKRIQQRRKLNGV